MRNIKQKTELMEKEKSILNSYIKVLLKTSRSFTKLVYNWANKNKINKHDK